MKAVAPKPPTPLPPACADCVTTLQPAQPGAAPTQTPFKMSRAADGTTRLDYGPTSVITNPVTQQMTLLDHLNKEVRVLPFPKPPMPAPPGMPGAPGLPGMPAPPPMPAMQVTELGKRMLDGQQVEGRAFTIPPMPPPAMPSAQLPGAPALPGAPGMPAAPGLPAKPPVPTVSEVWTSTSLHMPVLSTVTGPFGKQTCYCKNAVPGEPHPSMFQIPAGYKNLTPQ